MTDIDLVYTVTPKTQRVKLSCGEYEVKPLSVKALIELLAEMKDLQGQVKGKLGEGKDPEVVMSLLEQAGGKMPAIAAKLIGTADGAGLADMLLEDASVIALAVSEVNNFGRVFANFQKATARNKTE